MLYCCFCCLLCSYYRPTLDTPIWPTLWPLCLAGAGPHTSYHQTQHSRVWQTPQVWRTHDVDWPRHSGSSAGRIHRDHWSRVQFSLSPCAVVGPKALPGPPLLHRRTPPTGRCGDQSQPLWPPGPWQRGGLEQTVWPRLEVVCAYGPEELDARGGVWERGGDDVVAGAWSRGDRRTAYRVYPLSALV